MADYDRYLYLMQVYNNVVIIVKWTPSPRQRNKNKAPPTPRPGTNLWTKPCPSLYKTPPKPDSHSSTSPARTASCWRWPTALASSWRDAMRVRNMSKLRNLPAWLPRHSPMRPSRRRSPRPRIKERTVKRRRKRNDPTLISSILSSTCLHVEIDWTIY